MENVRKICLKPKSTFRFFNNRGAAIGTFTGLGVGFVIILLVTVLCRRRYRRRNKEREAQTWDTRISKPQIHRVSFADGSFARPDPRDLATMVGAHHRRNSTHGNPGRRPLEHAQGGSMAWERTKKRADMEEGTFYEARQPRLAEIKPAFVVGHRDDVLDRQVSRPMPKLPLHNKRPLNVDHSFPMSQSKAYLPFPVLQRVSHTPSSPSIYPPTLAVVDDDVSVRQLPNLNPTSYTYQKNATVPDHGHNRSANAKGRSLHRVRVKFGPGTALPDTEGDQNSSGFVQQMPSNDGNRGPVPPPIPPRSILRTPMSTQTMQLKREVPRPLNLSSASGLYLTDFLIMATGL
jgi:hypothetical protein